jgi:hypothetical protein
MRRGRAVSAVAVLALLGGFLISSEQVIAAPASPPGQTLAITDDPAGTLSGAGVLSDDGLTAAYQSRFTSDDRDGDQQIFTRSLTGGAPRLESGELPVGADAAAPTISGDGAKVGYQVDFRNTGVVSPSGGLPSFQRLGDHRIFVGPTNPVTGLTTDLDYQRTARCNPFLFQNATNDGCGPKLSGDGTTVVFPAIESIASPYLMPGPLNDSGTSFVPQTDRGGNYLPLFDFGFFSSSVALHLRINIFGAPVTFTAMPSADGVFEVAPNSSTESNDPDCNGHFNPGQFCSITIFYNAPRCGTPVTSFGTLRTTAETPAGNTVMSLAVTGCQTILTFAGTTTTAAAAAAALPAPCTAKPNPPAVGSQFEQHPGAPVGVYGEQPLHSVSYRSWTVTNTAEESNATLAYISPSCALSLDESVPDDPAGNPTCRAGTVLGPNRSCTAFVRFEPDQVAPYASGITLTANGSVRFVRFSGSGGERVVLGKRAGDDGRFAGVPFVVSAGEGGTAPVNGTDPSVSTDGNLVAFTSTCLPDGQVLPITGLACGAGPARRVYLRDIAAGTTRQVSLLPDGQPAPLAFAPSLSGDGRRVAFGTLRQVLSPAGGPGIATDHVLVRDLPSGRTILASARPGTPATPAVPGSSNPELSRDGSTVGYDSVAPDLVDPPFEPNGARVYVRDLGPDFGGPGTPGNEEISLGTVNGNAVDGPDSGHSALNADGGIIAFDSADRLTDAPVANNEGNTTAYARARFGNAEVDPDSLTFPTTQVGSTSPPQTVTITNGGPGPVRLTTSVVGPYTINASPCPVLHRGESCTVQVTAAPAEPGPQPGTLVIPSNSDFGPTRTVEVPLTGRAISPLITVRPARTDFPVGLVGATSKPIVVTVTNVSTVPLTITAGYKPATPNFTVKQSTCTGTLAPGATCTITVTYTPKTIGAHAGTLSLTVRNGVHEVDFTQGVPASGKTRTPKVTISPAVVPVGQVAEVTGTDFPPSQSVTVTWQNGLGEATVTTDAAGRFTTQLLTLRGDLVGARNPAATVTGIPVIKGPVVLIVPGSVQPPDFGTRN